MSRQLLIETSTFSPKPLIISENQGNGGNLFVEGILATTERINGNGRVYPQELWEREIEKFQEKIKAGTTNIVGELDHPDSEIINLKNGSHAIRKIWWEGPKIMGLLEIFCDLGEKGTSSGRIAGAYFKNKLNVGISSRGMGTLVENKRDGFMEVQDDFSLLTWDLVSNPSNPGSFMKQKLNESQIITPDKYLQVNNIIREILCSNGTCPIW